MRGREGVRAAEHVEIDTEPLVCAAFDRARFQASLAPAGGRTWRRFGLA